MPGLEWLKIIYADDEVVIRKRSGSQIVCYHRTTYNTPLFGKETTNWLCCGDWHWWDNKWTRNWSNDNATTIEEVVDIIKKGR